MYSVIVKGLKGFITNAFAFEYTYVYMHRSLFLSNKSLLM